MAAAAMTTAMSSAAAFRVAPTTRRAPSRASSTSPSSAVNVTTERNPLRAGAVACRPRRRLVVAAAAMRRLGDDPNAAGDDIASGYADTGRAAALTPGGSHSIVYMDRLSSNWMCFGECKINNVV
jgi:hypothetical protein